MRFLDPASFALLALFATMPAQAQTLSPPPGTLHPPTAHTTRPEREHATRPERERAKPAHAPHHTASHPTKHPAHPAPRHVPVVQAPKQQAAHPAPAAKSAPAPALPPAATPRKGSSTGLPLPRFVSLRSDEVNLRAGPGTRYPIEWVYKRRHLPVRIDREFDLWRLVTTPDGTRGWLHEATVIGRRSFVVTGAERTMRAAPRRDAAAVAHLMPGVIGHIRSCAAGADWCRVEVGSYRGWLPRSAFWGTFPGEAVR